MKYRVLALFLLVIAAAIVAGCTQSPAPVATTPAAVTTAAPQAAATAAPVTTFTLGQEYLHKKYSFTSEKDSFPPEQLRVTNDPWAIDITVNPTSTDPQGSWYEITATNIDNGHSQTLGYGRNYPLEKHQQLPMYNQGAYRFDMKGNHVSVDVIIAKRNP
jgi:hypothetical protein